MASVTATINVQINAANAAAQLTALQSKVAAMNKGMLAATAGGVMAQEKAIRRMGTILSGSGMFTTGIRNVHTELGRMHQEFDRGSTSLQNYRKNSRMWGKDHSNINRMAADRVRMLQSQYVALGKEMNGVQKAMQIKPDRMMREFGADAEYAHQRAMLFRRNLQMGSTALVNWGKNTQWAGRQMMVGMGIPIAIAAAGAVKAFNDIEKSSIAFKRVYGDATTSVAEKSQMLVKVQKTVGNEMMKYGIAMSDTLDVSAKAAATGARGADLIAATRETMRLATLGNMDYNKALEATIAMQTAFNINSKDMAKTTDFLNAVENQTILSMEDMALAVPRVAPVIKGLGGNVEELAIMMTALRQGGVSAEQGANALKSGLGSLLNPTGTAIEQFDQMGVNLKKIVETNKGDLIGTIQSLGKALDGLSKYDRQRALESLFGKYQYARMGALLKNINSKAVKETMRLAKAGNAELAKMSEQELGQISDSPMIKLRASIEELKAAAAPLGALFSDIAAKIVSFATPVVSFFANNDAARWGLVVGAGLAALAGTLTMIIGVFANFAGSMVKAGMAVRTFFRFITGQRSLAYVTTDGLEASAAANSLATAAERAAGGMMAEAKAAQLLTSQLEALIAAQNGAAATSRRPGPGTGGVPAVPGGPNVPVPSRPTAAVSAAYQLALRDVQRAHLGGAQLLDESQIAAARGVAQTTRAREVLSNLAPGSQVYGQNNRVFMGSKDFNNATKSGMSAAQWASTMRSQGANYTTSSLMSTIASNLGISGLDAQAEWARSPEGKQLRNAIFEGVVSDIERLGPDAMVSDNGTLKDGGTGHSIQKIADAAIAREVAAFRPEVQDAVRKTGEVGRVMVTDPSGKPGNWYTLGAPDVHGTQYDAPTKSGGLKVADLPEKFDGREGFGGVPTVVTDSDGKPVAKVIPQSSPEGRKISASSAYTPGGTRGVTYSASQLQQAAARAKTSIPSPSAATSGAAQQGRMGTRGMGMMGAGMLASTAIMGMQMAGKEVPAAAQFAANGLMGVGMAAQMFPKASEAIATKMSAVAGLFGPYGIAIAAAAAAVGGAVVLWKRFNEQTRQQGIDLGRALNDTTTNAEEVGTAFGKTSYVQQQAADDAGVKSDQVTTAQQFIESEAGKKLLDDYASTAMKVNQNVAGSSLASKLASYVISGVMGTSDVKSFLAALKTENPAQGAQIERYAKAVMGANFDKSPAELANEVYAKQAENTQTTANLLQQQNAAAIAETTGLGSRVGQFKDSSIWSKIVMGLQMAGSGGAALPGMLAGSEMQRQVAVRGSANRVGGLVASAWNSQVQSGLQNRLALEAQLNQLIDERQTLQKQADAGPLSEDDSKRLDYLNKTIPETRRGIGELGTSLQTTTKNMQQMFDAANGDQQGAVLESLNTMINDSKDGTAIFMADMIRNSQLGNNTQFDLLSKLQNGALNPLGMQNMMTNKNARGPMAGILGVTQSLPVDKLQSFSLEIGKMTGPQAQAALVSFGKRFVQAATAANLSSKEAKDAAKALGASQRQQNRVGVAVKMDKVKDITKGVNQKITVGANTESARKKIDDLRKAAEKATGKRIKINASDNAGQVIARLRKLIRAAEDADGKKIKIDADSSPAERKAAQVEAALSKGNPPPVEITAEDKASATITGVEAQWAATKASMATPPTLSVNDQATGTIAGIVSQLAGVQSKTITITTNYVENKATGGLYRGYATGGIHSGDGKVTGPGGPTDDKVNARLSRGEFVIRASSVNKYGTAFLDAVNRGMYDKNGFAKGTKPIGKAPLPPKEGDAKGRQAEFNREWRSVMYEAGNFIKEFNKMKKIIESGRTALSKQFKDMDYEFGRWLMDNYSPRQIKKMFKGNKDAGANKLAKQYEKEQKLLYRDEVRQQKTTSANARLRNQILLKNNAFGNEGAKATAIGNMSDEQLAMYKRLKPAKQDAFISRLVDAERVQQQQSKFAEAKNRKQELSKQYGSATGATLVSTAASQGMSVGQMQQAADALGMSIDDIDQQIKDGDLPSNFKTLAENAKAASKAMEVLSMTEAERVSQLISNRESMMTAYQNKASAKARSNIAIKYGKSQSVLEAEAAKSDALNAIDQATIDDINEKYSKQLEIFDQISQQQQAIANLERGRLTVANALSTGDIAAAAAAAQQQRSETASFMQGQMRTQLENQQKAQTQALQDAINERMRITRDIQNQIALEQANQNLAVAASIGDLQAQNDAIMMQDDYITLVNQAYVDQNALLVQNNSELDNMIARLAAIANIPAPDIVPDVPTPKGGGKPQSGKPKPKGKKGKKGKAFGGWVPGIGNSDSVPLLATPGEFVMRKAAAARFGPTLQAMNSGSFKDIGGSGGGVNIDNIIFNINGANLNERDIADIAVRKMKSLDSATIRGGRF